jgi:hypothetical protein
MRATFSLLILFPCAFPAHAQHEGHVMPNGEVMEGPMPESGGDEILGQPLGSGTSWLPEGSLVHAHAFHFMAGPWMLMAHGELFARYNAQNFNHTDKWPPPPSATAGNSFYPLLERGDQGADFPNWGMISAERSVLGEDRILLRVMMSLDPFTVGREGYPLLFQTGEGLVDRQHAHDLFMELGALYMHSLSLDHRVFAYLGLPGEPALGPTAFMHRPSIGGNPDAPLSHHSQDATHITYGVATLGWIYRDFKADASVFNGREPDNRRWDLEVGPLDSYSLRLTYNLGAFSLQGSGASILEGEHLDGDEGGRSVRATASVAHNTRVFEASKAGGANWANTVVYGMNKHPGDRPAISLLRESALESRRIGLWGRWESVQRPAEELDLPESLEGKYWVHALTAGAGANLFAIKGFDVFLGAQGTLNISESELYDAYGQYPLSGQFFVKVRPTGSSGH